MKTLKARVADGRMKLDVPTKLPEGTVLELTVADPGDDLGPAERKELHEAIEAGLESLKTGRLVPANDVLRTLRRSR